MARAEIFTPTYKADEIYSDFLINFDKNPITDNLAKATNENSVKQALKNLILTSNGERFYNNTFGSKLKSLLFDIVDISTMDLIKDTITQAITYNEPRVNLINVEIEDDSNNNAYKVSIYFNLINIPETSKLNLILKRVR